MLLAYRPVVSRVSLSTLHYRAQATGTEPNPVDRGRSTQAMRTNSDYAIIFFGEHLGDNMDDLIVPWANFVGNQSTQLAFGIDGQPVGQGYMLVQALHVGVFSHEILLNKIALPGPVLPQHDGWQTWMITIDEQILKQGRNTIQIVRDANTGDDFVIGNVVVHWRELYTGQ